METITRFKGVHRGADWFEVAVLTCGHEHHGHENGTRLAIGTEVACGLCAAGAPRPTLPTGGAHAAASMTPEARSERARKAAQARHAANHPKNTVTTFGTAITVQKLATGQWKAEIYRHDICAFAAERNDAVADVIRKGREYVADQWQARLRFIDLPKE